MFTNFLVVLIGFFVLLVSDTTRDKSLVSIKPGEVFIVECPGIEISAQDARELLGNPDWCSSFQSANLVTYFKMHYGQLGVTLVFFPGNEMCWATPGYFPTGGRLISIKWTRL